MIETWLPVVGLEGFYEISDHGNVRSRPRVKHFGQTGRGGEHIQLIRPRTLRQRLSPAGYLCVTLYDGWGKRLPKVVHLLVLEAHAGPRPIGLMGCHGPAGSRVNHVSNLRWDTQSNNVIDQLRHGTHPKGATLDTCGRGHARTPENTYWKRECKLCAHETAIARGKKKGRQIADLITTSQQSQGELVP